MMDVATANETKGQSLIVAVVGPATTGVVGMAEGLRVTVSMRVTVDAGPGLEWVHAAKPKVGKPPANRSAALICRRTALLPRPRHRRPSGRVIVRSLSFRRPSRGFPSLCSVENCARISLPGSFRSQWKNLVTLPRNS
jgi:hypothetical protein